MSQAVGYTVENQSWPTSAEANPLSVEDMYQLLEDEKFDSYHDQAAERLAHVRPPSDAARAK